MLDNNSEEMQLAECEAAITTGMKSFYYVGEALLRIRESRLYKVSGFTSFKDYCSEKWKMEEPHATRLIQSYNVMVQLQLDSRVNVQPLPIGNEKEDGILRPELSDLTLPVTESQVRELVKIKDSEKRKEVWEAAIHESEETGKPITAKSIAEVRDTIIPPDPADNPMKYRRVTYLNQYYDKKFEEMLRGEPEADYLRRILKAHIDHPELLNPYL